MTIDGWSIYNSLMLAYNAILARSKQIPAFLMLKRVDGLLSAVYTQDKYTVKIHFFYILPIKKSLATFRNDDGDLDSGINFIKLCKHALFRTVWGPYYGYAKIV